jgi:two-component system sensor histidine kinase KdpD
MRAGRQRLSLPGRAVRILQAAAAPQRIDRLPASRLASNLVQRIVVAGRLLVSIGIVAAITALYTALLGVNPTTVALSYLVAILYIATVWGIVEATATAIVAVLCLNFFFLPPLGTFTIADPENWIALLAFLITAITASQLSGRARRRELDAAARRDELERLYALSRGLLLSERGASIRREIARHIADTFALPTVAVYDRAADSASWAGPAEPPAFESRLRDVAMRATSLRDPSGLIIVAIRLGGAPIGSLALSDAGLSDTVVNSIANLAAIGLERARADETTARAEAARESSELRAAVLDALAHEFKTPLTSMKAASSHLLTGGAPTTKDRELVAIIDEELEHLGALVTDAVQMLRIDAGQFAVHRERHLLADVVDTTVKRFEPRLDGHAVAVHVPPGLAVAADRELLSLALRQLLDNAVKYSSPGSAIEVSATTGGGVDVAVHNSGPAIPGTEQPRIFDRFFRGTTARQIPGSGMGLAIVRRIAEAHGGTLRVDSSAEHGTTFTLSLPGEESKA